MTLMHPTESDTPDDDTWSDAPPTVSSSGTRALAGYLIEQQGLPAAPIEALLGMELETLQRPDVRVPLTAHQTLWHFAVEHTGDSALGLHLGERVEPDRMGLVGHILFNARTLGEALGHYVRLQQLVNEAQRLSLETRGAQAVLRWTQHPGTAYCAPDMDRTLAAAVTRARHFIHPKLRLRRLDLPHAMPPHAAEYLRLFQCEPRFEQDGAALYFDAHYLDKPLPQRNPYLYDALIGQVNGLLARLQPRQRFRRRVQSLIGRHLSAGQVDADTIAQALHMSRQTLYRKLKREDCSFQALVEDVRQARAQRYVADERYALSEIAFLLGFSELSAFSRAFKRWTGESPQRYRDQQRQAVDESGDEAEG